MYIMLITRPNGGYRRTEVCPIKDQEAFDAYCAEYSEGLKALNKTDNGNHYIEHRTGEGLARCFSGSRHLFDFVLDEVSE